MGYPLFYCKPSRYSLSSLISCTTPVETEVVSVLISVCRTSPPEVPTSLAKNIPTTATTRAANETHFTFALFLN